MTELASFALMGTMTAQGQGGGPLLTIASVRHRRGVEVIEADFSRPKDGRRTFTAKFRGTHRQATAVLRTTENQVEVLDAVLYDFFDNRSASQPLRQGAS